jgi:hypothetical protein
MATAKSVTPHYTKPQPQGWLPRCPSPGIDRTLLERPVPFLLIRPLDEDLQRLAPGTESSLIHRAADLGGSGHEIASPRLTSQMTPDRFQVREELLVGYPPLLGRLKPSTLQRLVPRAEAAAHGFGPVAPEGCIPLHRDTRRAALLRYLAEVGQQVIVRNVPAEGRKVEMDHDSECAL